MYQGSRFIRDTAVQKLIGVINKALAFRAEQAKDEAPRSSLVFPHLLSSPAYPRLQYPQYPGPQHPGPQHLPTVPISQNGPNSHGSNTHGSTPAVLCCAYPVCCPVPFLCRPVPPPPMCSRLSGVQEKELGWLHAGCKHSQAKKLGDVTTCNVTMLRSGGAPPTSPSHPNAQPFPAPSPPHCTPTETPTKTKPTTTKPMRRRQ
jgi:hypothetical protein